MMSVSNNFRSIYKKLSPLVANMCVCGSLYCLGDLTQQTLFKGKDQDYDLVGTKRITCMSFFGFGPIYYYWYKFLDGKFPGTLTRTVVKKIFLDQTVATPVCLTTFYVGLSFMEGQKDLFREFREKAPKTYITGCLFWPVAQSINFAFCPPHLRVVYTSSCAFVWSIILCYIKGQKKTDLITAVDHNVES